MDAAMVWRAAAVLLATALALYAVLLAAVALGQERLLFQPAPLPAQHRHALDADVHESWIDVPGARLNMLHLRLPQPDGVVFYLHGNAGNLASWFVDADFHRQLNLDLVMIDYRGYGKSSGRIESQAQLEADVRAAWQAVAPQYEGRRRIVHGRSLGTALAAQLAAEVHPDLTVLVAPYTSMHALAARHYPWVPGVLLRYPLRCDDAVARITGPVLLAHGGADALIEADHSHTLLKRARNGTLLIVPDAGHNDIDGFDAYRDALRRHYRPDSAHRVPKIASPAPPRPGML